LIERTFKRDLKKKEGGMEECLNNHRFRLPPRNRLWKEVSEFRKGKSRDKREKKKERNKGRETISRAGFQRRPHLDLNSQTLCEVNWGRRIGERCGEDAFGLHQRP